jgi:tetratricopeptide (TPR) repeat protein
MKALHLLITFLLAMSVALLQGQSKEEEELVESVFEHLDPENYQVKEAYLLVENAKENPQRLSEPGYWYARGAALHAIYEHEDPAIRQMLRNPVPEVYECYVKAVEMDHENNYSEDLYKRLEILTYQLSNEGVDEFNGKMYQKSLDMFQKALYINGKYLNKIDTIIIYNAAMAADRLGMDDKAEGYYRLLMEWEYNYKGVGPNLYANLAEIYQVKNLRDRAEDLLREGIEQYPNSVTMITELINYYLENDRAEAALAFIQQNIAKEPENEVYHFAAGTLFENLGRYEEAYTAYQKALDLNGDFFDAAYNMGAIYYNQGVKKYRLASDEVDQDVRQEYQEEARMMLEKSEPYLEMAHDIEPNDPRTLAALKDVYKNLGKTDELKKLEQESAPTPGGMPDLRGGEIIDQNEGF